MMLTDLEYEERAEKVMPKFSSSCSGIVEIKKKYWYESRSRIISILKQLHKAKQQAKRIAELEADAKIKQSVCDTIVKEVTEINEKLKTELTESNKQNERLQKDIDCINELCDNYDEFGEPFKESEWPFLSERVFGIITELLDEIKALNPPPKQ